MENLPSESHSFLQDIPDETAFQTAYSWAINFDCYSNDAKRQKSAAIKLLNRVVDKTVRKNIDEISITDRLILLISQDENLIEGVASYIFWKNHIKSDGFFYSENFIGCDKNDTLKRLFGTDAELTNAIKQYYFDGRYLDRLMDKIAHSEYDLLQYFNLGGTLLLKNMEDVCILTQIAKITRKTCSDINSLLNDPIIHGIAKSHAFWRDEDRDTIIKSDTFQGEKDRDNKYFWITHTGKIIVSVNNGNNLPDHLKSVYKIIDIGPEKRNTSLGASNQNKEKQEDKYIFKKEGKRWFTCYGKTTAYLETGGLAYIGCALENPNKNLFNTDLSKLVRKQQRGKLTKEQAYQDGLRVDNVKTTIKKDRNDINEDESRHSEGQEALETEKQDLKDELMDQDIPTSDERMHEIEIRLNEIAEIEKTVSRNPESRNNSQVKPESVYKAIKRSMKEIEEHNKPLWQYLRTHFKYGIETTMYSCENPLNWIIT